MSYYPVLVNKTHLLPFDYIPDDLEEAGIPFCAPPGSEKRLLRRKASKAAGRLFTQAALDKMGIIGISQEQRKYHRISLGALAYPLCRRASGLISFYDRSDFGRIPQFIEENFLFSG